MSREYKEIPPLTIKQVDRFYSKYAISTTPPNFSSPCWNWTGTVSGGYGRLSIGKLWFKAHRISYYLHHKELPTDLTIDHLCKNTLCVNPDDVALLDGFETTLTIVGDPSLPRGDLRIDCSAGWIEHGTSLYLDALRSELGLSEPEA